MADESVDLIATDPPFNKGRDFHATPDSLADGASFQDRWRWIEDVQPDWVEAIERDWEGVSWAIESARVTYGEDMAAFLCFLGVRVIEMHRVLAPHGSIYLHCDDTAGAYIKTLMDAIFGRDNFRNTITWKRTTGRSDAQRFARVSDRILYYVKGDGEPTWNGAWTPLDTESITKFYRYEDARGYYASDNLTGPAHNADGSTPSAQQWRGVDPLAVGRVWSVPKTGAYAEWIEREVIPGYRSIESIAGRLDALDMAGLIAWPQRGGMPRFKRYLEASRGVAASDIITDIGVLAAHATERTGYPTQKPIALYQRLIAASSNPGDVVLDPFAGCATTPIAAELEGRRWIAMDIWDGAHEVVTNRLQKEVRLANPDARIDYSVRLVTEVPERAPDAGKAAAPFLATPTGKVKRQRPAWQRMTKAEMVRTLAEAQRGDAGVVVCVGCGVELAARYFELDHREPKGIGGEDWITNRVLLCGPCNGRKSHRFTLAGLRADNSKPDALGETWMVDALAAEAADRRARDATRAIRDGR